MQEDIRRSNSKSDVHHLQIRHYLQNKDIVKEVSEEQRQSSHLDSMDMNKLLLEVSADVKEEKKLEEEILKGAPSPEKAATKM